MAFIVIALTLFFFVGLPLAAAMAFVAVVRGVERPKGDPEFSYPTTLQVGKRGVLSAIADKDLVGARTAFLDMVGACGTCHKLYRRRIASCGSACSKVS